MSIERVEKALREIRAGRMVILVDDEDRENEGDLCMAAEKVTPEAVNFMAREGRGLICLTLTESRVRQLELPMMVGDNTSPLGTAFTVSVEAARGVTTGISAADRAHTIQVAIAEEARPGDLTRPGHVFPLVAKKGGVLVRTGQTEGSVDLSRLAGLKPAGVICEIMNDDGSMARRPDLEAFAARHDLTILTIADLIDYRMHRESLVHKVAEADVPMGQLGTFRVIAWRDGSRGHVHLAFVRGAWTEDDAVLVRVQNRPLMADVIGAARSDGGPSLLERALGRVAEEGAGVVVYLRTHPEAFETEILRRLGASETREVAAEPEAGEPEVRPDLREFGIGAQILAELGVRRLRLMSNTPTKIVGLEGFGLTMVERIPLPPPPMAKGPDAPARNKGGG